MRRLYRSASQMIAMSNEYRNNHYVPVWYQNRFIPQYAKDKELLYLDLNPGVFTDPRGIVHPRRPIKRLGPKHCFYERDLYTSKFANTESTDIERLFFGQIDWQGRKGVEHFAEFNHLKSGTHEALEPLLLYMSTQKLRTPKGLGWLAAQTRTSDDNAVLRQLMRFRHLFCAIWTESVWLIADASQSATKFLVSDCPVTIYNRSCGPRSQRCRGYNDPAIWLNGTHTVFPLSLDKVLILTNLSWVRNPYQNPVKDRPHPNPLRNALFMIFDIQVDRHLNEQEVREINFITKSRAFKYVAAAEEDWLYPERYISKSDWAQYGHGYLLMPDPRSVGFTKEILLGFNNGRAAAFDEYGRRPWQIDYRKSETSGSKEWRTFQRFKGEFARLFGPCRRGRANHLGTLDIERDSDEAHRAHCSMGKRRKR